MLSVWFAVDRWCQMLIKHLMMHVSCSDTPLQTHVGDLSYPLSVFMATCCHRSPYYTMQSFIVAQKRIVWTTVFKYVCCHLPVKTQSYYSIVKTLSVHRHLHYHSFTNALSHNNLWIAIHLVVIPNYNTRICEYSHSDLCSVIHFWKSQFWCWVTKHHQNCDLFL